MSFRCRQKYHSAPTGSVVAFEPKTLETGVVEVNAVDMCEKVLPKPELFNLRTNIEAGVNMKETSSKILSGASINIEDMVKESEKFDESETKTNEVNDEN